MYSHLITSHDFQTVLCLPDGFRCSKPSLCRYFSRKVPATGFVNISAGLFFPRIGSTFKCPSFTLSCTHRYLVCTCLIRPNPCRSENPRAADESLSTSNSISTPRSRSKLCRQSPAAAPFVMPYHSLSPLDNETVLCKLLPCFTQ